MRGPLGTLGVELVPGTGAASPDELARDYEAALNNRDADSLANLLGAPIKGDTGDVAKFLVNAPHQGQWHVTVSTEGDTTYLAVADDRQSAARLVATAEDGRWQVNPLATG